MEKWIPILILFVLCVAGFIKLLFEVRAFYKRLNFAVEFRERFIEYVNGLMQKEERHDLYARLKVDSVKIQQYMDRAGISVSFQLPFANYIYNNFQVVINGLSMIREEYQRMDKSFPLPFEIRMLQDTARILDDALLAYVGHLDMLEEQLTKKIKNPVIWLREGVRMIVTFPISFMYWSGIMRYATYSRWSNNFFVKLVSSVIGFISFFSAIVTLVTGYSPFVQIIENHYPGILP